MKEKQAFDFWYAVNNTEIVLMPVRHLETFGNTILNYHLVTELMDTISQIRVREGRIRASQPKIITPDAYAQTVLEGFGDEAGKYVEWLKEHEKDIRILQYGYTLKQESFSEHIVTDNIKAVTGRVQAQVKESGDPLSAVLVGVDEPWDVCLVKLFWEVIRKSVAPNIRDLEKRSLFDDDGGVPRAIRNEIDHAFTAASRDPALVNPLGTKLQRFGLFEEYQDRFFSLVRSHKR